MKNVEKVQRVRLEWNEWSEAPWSYTCPSVSTRTQRSLSGLIGRVMAEARYQSSLVRRSSLSADLMSKAPLAGLLLNGTCCAIWSVFPMRDHQRISTWVGSCFFFFPPSCPQRQYLCRGSDRSDSGRGDMGGISTLLDLPRNHLCGWGNDRHASLWHAGNVKLYCFHQFKGFCVFFFFNVNTHGGFVVYQEFSWGRLPLGFDSLFRY